MKFRQCIQTIAPYQPGLRSQGSIKLSSNENPLGPSPRAMDAVRETVPMIHTYPDGANRELTAAISDRLGVGSDQIIIGNGSDELFLQIAGILLEGDSTAVSARQTFSEYRFSVAVFGGTMREVNLTPQGRFDLQAILHACDDSTRLVFICNPNNPTGTYLTHRELLDFLTVMNDRFPDALVVVDEAYQDYVTAPDFPDSVALLASCPNMIITRTFSKIYGLAGLRVGYAVSHPEVIAQLKRVKQPFNVNLLAQSAARAALSDEDFHHRSREINQLSKTRLTGLCDSLGFSYFQTQANFLCITLAEDLGIESVELPPTALGEYRLPDGVNNLSSFAFRHFNEYGVSIRALQSFGLPSAVRITLGMDEQMQGVYQGLERLAELARKGS